MWGVCDKCNYWSFWAIFCPFTPRNIPKNQNFEKIKKMPGDIIILHKSIKNYDQMVYDSWDIAHDKCNYFSFWAIFCPLTPVTSQKIKILRKWKKYLETSFYISLPKMMIRWCTVPEIWCATTDRQRKWCIEVVAPPKNLLKVSMEC